MARIAAAVMRMEVMMGFCMTCCAFTHAPIISPFSFLGFCGMAVFSGLSGFPVRLSAGWVLRKFSQFGFFPGFCGKRCG
jgi:hypothetical protein